MFANRLRELRLEKGLSQKRIGAYLNITQQAVAKWESGHTEPAIDVLFKLCEILDCDLNYLIGNSHGTQQDDDMLRPDGKRMTSREKVQLNEVLDNANALFFDEEISESDKEKFFRDLTAAFWKAKDLNKRTK